MKAIFTQNIRVKNKNIHKERAIAFIDNLHVKEGREYKCTVEPLEEDRSLEQNAYFHAVVVPACMTLGYTAPEAKATLKAELLPINTVRKLNGEMTTELTHTSKLGIRKMAKFLDECIIILGTYGVSVPPPQWRE